MRRVALLVCVMVTALVGATGVALAAAQNETQDNTIRRSAASRRRAKRGLRAGTGRRGKER